MHAQWFDPELSQQMFENALAAVALSFIALAFLAALVAYVFVVYECYRVTRPPAKPRAEVRCIKPGDVKAARRLQLVHR